MYVLYGIDMLRHSRRHTKNYVRNSLIKMMSWWTRPYCVNGGCRGRPVFLQGVPIRNIFHGALRTFTQPPFKTYCFLVNFIIIYVVCCMSRARVCLSVLSCNSGQSNKCLSVRTPAAVLTRFNYEMRFFRLPTEHQECLIFWEIQGRQCVNKENSSQADMEISSVRPG